MKSIDSKKEFSDEEYEKFDELKMIGLESILGISHSVMGHAIIPFELGGSVDMYYFPNGIQGTGFATMELIEPDGTGPIHSHLGACELVAFTKLDFVEDTDNTTPFDIIERRICSLFTAVGDYSYTADLTPLDTCEVPIDDTIGQTACLILDEYSLDGQEFKIKNNTHGLLLIMEVHKNEMEFALAHGTTKLIDRLKEAGYYPYSDLERESVV
jgi:hypothetical protein